MSSFTLDIHTFHMRYCPSLLANSSARMCIQIYNFIKGLCGRGLTLPSLGEKSNNISHNSMCIFRVVRRLVLKLWALKTKLDGFLLVSWIMTDSLCVRKGLHTKRLLPVFQVYTKNEMCVYPLCEQNAGREWSEQLFCVECGAGLQKISASALTPTPLQTCSSVTDTVCLKQAKSIRHLCVLVTCLIRCPQGPIV